MKKILGIVVLGLLWCNVSFADESELNIEIKKAVQENDVKAILIVHLYGFVHPQLDAIKNYCLDNDIVLVEDGSHAFGTKYKGEYVLKNSHLAGVSLFPTKIFYSSQLRPFLVFI